MFFLDGFCRQADGGGVTQRAPQTSLVPKGRAARLGQESSGGWGLDPAPGSVWPGTHLGHPILAFRADWSQPDRKPISEMGLWGVDLKAGQGNAAAGWLQGL